MISYTGWPLPTQSMFYEMTYDKERDIDLCLFTLSENDKEIKGRVYHSLKKLYLDMEDLSEYEFATVIFGSYRIWENLCSVKWFQKHLEVWRRELRIKIRGKALKEMIRSLDGTKSPPSFNTMKYLAELDKTQGNTKLTKDKIRKEKEEAYKDVLNLDAKRLGLVDG